MVEKYPTFPLHVLLLPDRLQWIIPDELSLCMRVEWHDTSDPVDAAECRIVDALGRPVDALLVGLEIKHLRLASETASARTTFNE